MTQPTLLTALAAHISFADVITAVLAAGASLAALAVVVISVSKVLKMIDGDIPRQKSLREYEDFLEVERIKQKMRLSSRAKSELKAERFTWF